MKRIDSATFSLTLGLWPKVWVPGYLDGKKTVGKSMTRIYGVLIYGKKFGKLQRPLTSLFHVDAHAKKTSVEREYNADVDCLTTIAEVECFTPISEETLALARWIHQKTGHAGSAAMHRTEGLDLFPG